MLSRHRFAVREKSWKPAKARHRVISETRGRRSLCQPLISIEQKPPRYGDEHSRCSRADLGLRWVAWNVHQYHVKGWSAIRLTCVIRRVISRFTPSSLALAGLWREWFTESLWEIVWRMCIGGRRAAGAKSENARLTWLDLCGHWRRGLFGRDVETAQEKSWGGSRWTLPAGYSLIGLANMNYMQRRKKSWRMWVLWHWSIIIVLLSSFFELFLRSPSLMGTCPLPWWQYLADVFVLASTSRLRGVGFIGLAGVAVEIGVSLALGYLNQRWGWDGQRKCAEKGRSRVWTRFITRCFTCGYAGSSLWWWPLRGNYYRLTAYFCMVLGTGSEEGMSRIGPRLWSVWFGARSCCR